MTTRGDIGLTEGLDRLDLAVSGNDLALDDSLKTAVLLSLFTDQRVSTSELPSGESWRRGWWGDTVAEIVGDKHGSKLWLLNREKQTPEVAERAREYCKEALQWLIEDGVASSISVSTRFEGRGILKIEITIARDSGDATSLAFDYVWQAAKG